MAIHKVGCFRGKENNGTKQVVKLTKALHWNPAENPFAFCTVFQKRFIYCGQGENRSDGIHVYSFGSPLNSQRTGKLIYPSFTRRIGSIFNPALKTSNR